MEQKTKFRQRQLACKLWVTFALIDKTLRKVRSEMNKKIRYQEYIIHQTFLANQMKVKHPDEIEAEEAAAKAEEAAALQAELAAKEAEEKEQEHEEGKFEEASVEMMDSMSNPENNSPSPSPSPVFETELQQQE